MIDSKGTIESFNRGAERLFGYGGRSHRPQRQHADAIARSTNHDGYLERYLTTGAEIIGVAAR